MWKLFQVLLSIAKAKYTSCRDAIIQAAFDSLSKIERNFIFLFSILKNQLKIKNLNLSNAHKESFVNSEDTDPIEVSKLIARSDMERKDCCESDSVTQDCLGLCDGAQTLFWSKQYSKCSSVNRLFCKANLSFINYFRQIYSCWSRTTCVGRCNDKPRTDHKCQCDLDCMMRGVRCCFYYILLTEFLGLLYRHAIRL